MLLLKQPSRFFIANGGTKAMLNMGVVPVETMSNFLERRHASDSGPVTAVVQWTSVRSGLLLAREALACLDDQAGQGAQIDRNLRSRVWATACALASMASNGALGEVPGLAGVLLSDGPLPAENEAMDQELFDLLVQLAQTEVQARAI